MTHAPVTPSTKKPIPEFTSYEEEAEFWDTHEVIEYFDDFQVSPPPLGEFAGRLVGIPIMSAQMRVLSERARAEGTNEVELARRWGAERIASVDAEGGDVSPSPR